MNATQNGSNLTDADGIGPKTAKNLLDAFDTTDVALDAVQTIPGWVRENIDGIGEANLENLREYARVNGHNDQTDRTLSLRGKKITYRDERYYACGQRADNLVLFYTGMYQGRSYSTTFSGRQRMTRDRVNRHAWAFFSFSERGYIVVDTHWGGKGQYIADVIDEHDWKQITDTGAVYYQRNRNYEVDDYPETTKGMKQSSRVGGVSDLLPNLELVGVTKDRIAIYRKGNGLFKFVHDPARGDGVMRRLYGYTHFGTDADLDLGEFGTVETFVKKWADEEKWKDYAGEPYLTETYKKMV